MRGGTIVVASALLFGCGAGEFEPQILAQTQGVGDKDAGTHEMEGLVGRDEAIAVEALLGAVSARNDTGSLAAAYALRLGVARGGDTVEEAIERGASSEDALVAALSWRWIASGALGAPPEWRKKTPEEPVVGVFAAAAFARAGSRLPDPLADALGSPEGAPTERDPPEDRNRVSALRAAAAPFDGGPLGLALAFVEARRERWIDSNERGPSSFAASRLRDDLLEALGGGAGAFPGLAAVKPVRDPMYSRLASKLETPLPSSPLPMLRGAAVRGEGTLRIDALRALSIAVKRPAAGDLGAAASALASDDPAIRIEAARTYLLLAVRAAE